MAAQTNKTENQTENLSTPTANSLPWDQLNIPSVDWARQNPDKLMGFIMVAQIDFPELAEMLR